MNAQDAGRVCDHPARQDRNRNADTIAPQRTAGQSRPPAKIERVLAELIEGARTSRELEGPPCFDHCANATASDLKRLSVAIAAERVRINGFAGLPCWVARYSIAPEGRAFALELLEKMRARRGVR